MSRWVAGALAVAMARMRPGLHMGRRRGGGTDQARKWDQARVQVQELVWIVLGAQKYRGRLMGGLFVGCRRGCDGSPWLGLPYLTASEGLATLAASSSFPVDQSEGRVVECGRGSQTVGRVS